LRAPRDCGTSAAWSNSGLKVKAKMTEIVRFRGKQSVTAEEKAVLLNTMQALDAFINIRETMPIQYVKAFMLVATDEGHNVTWYATKAGITPSLMTRHLADLGTTNRYHDAGFGPIEQYDNVLDRRERLIRLTAKGKGIVGQICEAFA
jgi:DNA-binding MarR family transcriptional regulator